MASSTALSPCQKGLLATSITIGTLSLAVTAVALAAIFIPAAFPALFAAAAIYIAVGAGSIALISAIVAIAVRSLITRASPMAIESEDSDSNEAKGSTHMGAIAQSFEKELGEASRYTEILVCLWTLDENGNLIKAESDFMDDLDSALTQAFTKIGNKNISEPYAWHVIAQYEDGSNQSLSATCASTLNEGEEVYCIEKDISRLAVATCINKVGPTLENFVKQQMPQKDKS